MWHPGAQNDSGRPKWDKKGVPLESGSRISGNICSGGQKTSFQSFIRSTAAMNDKMVPGKNTMCVLRGETALVRVHSQSPVSQGKLAQAKDSAINHVN